MHVNLEPADRCTTTAVRHDWHAGQLATAIHVPPHSSDCRTAIVGCLVNTGLSGACTIEPSTASPGQRGSPSLQLGLRLRALPAPDLADLYLKLGDGHKAGRDDRLTILAFGNLSSNVNSMHLRCHPTQSMHSMYMPDAGSAVMMLTTA